MNKIKIFFSQTNKQTKKNDSKLWILEIHFLNLVKENHIIILDSDRRWWWWQWRFSMRQTKQALSCFCICLWTLLILEKLRKRSQNKIVGQTVSRRAGWVKVFLLRDASQRNVQLSTWETKNETRKEEEETSWSRMILDGRDFLSHGWRLINQVLSSFDHTNGRLVSRPDSAWVPVWYRSFRDISSALRLWSWDWSTCSICSCTPYSLACFWTRSTFWIYSAVSWS